MMTRDNCKQAAGEASVEGLVPARQSLAPEKERLLALDVFRGLTLFSMVLVNSHGDSQYVLMKFVPVPGYGAGVLDKVGNWAQYIDARVLGAHCGGAYNGFVYEGKGLLSTLPAIVTSLMGLWTGRYLRSPAAPLEKAANLYFLGAIAMFFGAFWNNFFPINQNLWTSSLVLLMGGMAVVVLASCYYITAVRKVAWWTPPFLVFGMSSIAVWVGSITLEDTLEKIQFAGGDGKLIDLKARMFNGLAHWLGPWNGSLAFAILYVLFWLAVMSVFHRKRIFFKI
jgi:predicted acyltransferase